VHTRCSFANSTHSLPGEAQIGIHASRVTRVGLNGRAMLGLKNSRKKQAQRNSRAEKAAVGTAASSLRATS